MKTSLVRTKKKLKKQTILEEVNITPPSVLESFEVLVPINLESMPFVQLNLFTSHPISFAEPCNWIPNVQMLIKIQNGSDESADIEIQNNKYKQFITILKSL